MYLPAILEFTSEGVHRYGIQEYMLQNRKVECPFEITPETANALILQLRYLREMDQTAPITLYISSPGGEVNSGLAIYDFMQLLPCPIHTVCLGKASSMAAILFLSGQKRSMLPHAHLMLHDPLLPHGLSGSALKVDQISRELMRTRENLAGIIAKHSGKSLEEVYAITAKDSEFGAQEAVDWGLADEILCEL